MNYNGGVNLRKEIKERIEMINKGEVPEGYKKTKAGIIPEDWEVKRLGSVCEMYSGGTPKTSNRDYYNGDIPWITSGDLNKGKIKSVSGKISKSGLKNSSAKMINKGDLLLALYGATAGVSAISAIDAAINQAVLAILPTKESNKYLYYVLSLKKDFIINKYTQGGQPNLSAAIIKSLRMSFPPLPEQQKIAQILSTWDEAIELKEKLIEEKKEQKKGLMQRLLTGEVRLPGFDGQWEKVRLGKVLFFPKKEALLNPQDYYLLTVKLHLNGIEATDKKPNKTKRGRPYYMREPKELLIGRQNFHNGGIGIVPDEMENYIASNAISTLQAKKGDIKFYYYYLSNANFYKRIGHIVGGTGQKEISETEMKKLKLIIPKSLQEQKAIAKILSTADKEIELLTQELEQLKLQKKGLMQLLLTGIIRVKS